MKILFITAYPPNRQTAGQNFSRQLINDISRNNTVNIIYFDYPRHKIEVDNKLIIRREKLTIFHKLTGSLLLCFLFPLFSVRFKLSTYFFILKIRNDYDLLYFDFSQVFIYSWLIKHPNKILMSHDVIYQKYQRRNLYKYLIPQIKMSERLLDNSGHKTLCFSEKDKTLIRNISHKDVFVVPFYINTSIREIDCSKIEIENYFVFYGAWNRNENEEGLVWFIEQVYPQLDTELQFRIIGGQMRESVKEKIAKYSNIEYLGFVENPYLILSKSQALIAPLFNGAGVKVKVLESLATGTPVIGSSVAHEGLMEYANINGQKMLYLADNSNDMVKALSEWTLITSSEKVSAKESFLNRYLGSTNHLKDIFSC